MSNIQFNEEEQLTQAPASLYSTKPKGLEGFIISLGLAKDRKSAQIVLLVVAVVAVIIGVVVAFGMGGSSMQGDPIDYITTQ